MQAAGKELRSRVPRSSHAAWKAPAGRPDPTAILQAADSSRIADLVPIRYGRMLQSPFAYYRGSASVMAGDLASLPATGIIVQCCGDCHLKNFGGFATPERNIIFDINDFDETLPASWEWDVKRLAASFVLAARANNLPEDAGREAAVLSASSYRNAMRGYAKLDPLELWYSKLDADEVLREVNDGAIEARLERRIEKAREQRLSDVGGGKVTTVTGGEVRIREQPPLIFHPDESKNPEFRAVVEEMLNRYRETLYDDRRVLFDRFRFEDAAMKVVGVGSVGTRCWIVLLTSDSEHQLLLQFKQANPSVLEPYAGKSEYEHHGKRVVMGQRLMQAASDVFLGWVSGPSGDFYVRQLRDAKINPLIESFDAPTLSTYAGICGRDLARAHAKTGNTWLLSGYLGKSDSFERAIGQFSAAYADQAEKDYDELKSAVRSGKINAYVE